MKDFTKPASNRPTCRSKFSFTTTVKDKDCLGFSVWTWGDQKSKDINTSSSYRIFFFSTQKDIPPIELLSLQEGRHRAQTSAWWSYLNLTDESHCSRCCIHSRDHCWWLQGWLLVLQIMTGVKEKGCRRSEHTFRCRAEMFLSSHLFLPPQTMLL